MRCEGQESTLPSLRPMQHSSQPSMELWPSQLSPCIVSAPHGLVAADGGQAKLGHHGAEGEGGSKGVDRGGLAPLLQHHFMMKVHAQRPASSAAIELSTPQLSSHPPCPIALVFPPHLKAAPGEAIPKPASAASASASEHAECRVSRKSCWGVRTFLAAATVAEAGGAGAGSCGTDKGSRQGCWGQETLAAAQVLPMRMPGLAAEPPTHCSIGSKCGPSTHRQRRGGPAQLASLQHQRAPVGRGWAVEEGHGWLGWCVD